MGLPSDQRPIVPRVAGRVDATNRVGSCSSRGGAGCVAGKAGGDARSRKGDGSASYIPAPESLTTVASFRPWRDSQAIVAGEPTEPPWRWRLDDAAGEKLAERAGFEPAKRG